MTQKKYMDIVRLGHKTTQGILNVGDNIIIQEKIDGANASFKREGDILRAYSRNHELLGEDGLGGFRQWVTNTFEPSKLIDGITYFGEWTNPHKVKYPDFTKQFFLFDLYNEYLEEYFDFSAVEQEAKRLGINTVPILYRGAYQSFEHLQSFLGKSMLGGKLGDIETNEGIVVKRSDYKDRFGNQQFVKLVVDEFREVQSQKPARDPNQAESLEAQWVTNNLTRARVDKMLLKLVDEDVIDAEFGIEDMGTILKNINKRLIDDMTKEEADYLPQEYEVSEIGKAVARKSPLIIKQIIIDKETQLV